MGNPTLMQWLMIFISSQGFYILLVIRRTTNYRTMRPRDDIMTTSKSVPHRPNPEIHRLKVSVFKDKYQYFTFTKIPRLKNRKNNAILNMKDNCLFDEYSVNSTAYIIVVTNYHSNEMNKYNQAIYARSPPTIDEIQARDAEILQTLQNNLKNELVSKSYVFVQHYESAVFLNSLDFVNSEKLVIQWTNETILLAKTMMYISKCLQNKIVLKLHQDNRIGRGFERINRDVLVQNRLMYALTRQASSEYCFHSWRQANCAVGQYDGSHDAFMFHVKNFTDGDFEYLESTKAETHDLGMENIFLWVFIHVLKYEILNPCKDLHIHHEHCVPIRRKRSRRINDQVSAEVPYSNLPT